MSEASRKARTRKAQGEILLHRVDEIARAGDRYFIALARQLSRLTQWTERESHIATDSAVAAFNTTVDFTRRMAARQGLPVRERVDARTRAYRERHPNPKLGPEFVTATRAEATDSGPAEPRGAPAAPACVAVSDPVPSYSPGVAPLIEALGDVVAEYSEAGYSKLGADTRFWTLIQLLQFLGVEPESNSPTTHHESMGEASESRLDAESLGSSSEEVL